MLISIIIPAYNLGQHIERTLDSLISQNNIDFEVIVVNDGSSDSTEEIAKQKLSYSGIKNYKILNQENSGVSVARNRGLIESSGEYVLFLDGDDTVSSSIISVLESIVLKDRPEIICWGYRKIKDDHTIVNEYVDEFINRETKITGINAINRSLVDNKLHLWTGSVAFKKSFLIENDLFFYPNCVSGEDQEFIFSALIEADTVVYEKNVMSNYIIREGSITNGFNIRRFDSVDAMKRLFSFIENNKKFELTRVSDQTKYKKILDSYFYNLDSCIKYNLKENQQLNMNHILTKIDSAYPTMNAEIKDLIKKTGLRSGLKNYLKINIFCFFPTGYYYLTQLSWVKLGK